MNVLNSNVLKIKFGSFRKALQIFRTKKIHGLANDIFHLSYLLKCKVGIRILKAGT